MKLSNGTNNLMCISPGTIIPLGELLFLITALYFVREQGSQRSTRTALICTYGEANLRIAKLGLAKKEDQDVPKGR